MQEPRRRSRYTFPIALGTIAVILVVGALEFTNAPASTSTSIPSLAPSEQVTAAFSDHLDKLVAMNTTAMEADYLPNATASLVSLGKGNYYERSLANKTTSENATTPQQIQILFQGVFFSDFIIPHVADENNTVSVSGNAAYVTSTFALTGTNVDGTSLIAAVDCQVTYVHTGRSWLISREVWTLTMVNSH